MLNKQELENMSFEELIKYFISIDLTKEQAIDMLNEWEIPYKKNLSKRRLIYHLANQIEGIGIYKRIAGIE